MLGNHGAGRGDVVASAHPDPTRRLRRDLQGVRGLGIILVVVGHLWRWPPGVFAMLDMFFVLSGFLITAILVKALTKYGPRFLLVFALSRLRRLMPAAVAAIVVTVAVTYAVYSSVRGDMVARDGLWALLWVVNWHFAMTGTDYFRDDMSGSPLLHYWSLSVEEQFYAVWPLLVLLLVVLGARSRRLTPTAVFGLGIGAVTVAAFTYSLWHSTVSPTVAYFSTLDRAWEFGIGGLVAVFAPQLARLPFRLAFLLSWGGTIGLVLTLYLLPYGVPFPAPYGLFPSLLTAAIIIGGLERDTGYIPLLDNPVMIYLGDLSYSIYLWHLPVNVMLRPFFPEGDARYYMAAITVTAVTSVLCYYLIERPLRHAPWLMTRPERARRPPAENTRAVGYGWLAVATVAVLALSGTALLRPTAPPSEAAGPVEGQVERRQDDRSPLVRQQERSVIQALERSDFPEFDPPLEELTFEHWLRDLKVTVCADTHAKELDECVFGKPGARRQALVVGDSFAMGWMPGIERALVPRGWRVQQITGGQCPTWTLPGYVTLERKPHPHCQAQHDLIAEVVRATEPDLLVLASAPGHVRNAIRDDLPDSQRQVAEEGLALTLRALAPSVGRTVVLAPPRPHKSLTQCVTRTAGPDLCVSTSDSQWSDHVAGEMAAANDVGVDYVVTDSWFCYQGRCPAFVGTTPVTIDGGHLTVPFSESLAPLLAEALLGPRGTAR